MVDTRSSDIKRSACVAIFSGTLVSVALFLWVYSTRGAFFLYWPQAVGFYTCMLIRGVHSATKSDYAAIGIPINAAIYAVVIFRLLRGITKKRTSI
jgi:hypothetical protein